MASPALSGTLTADNLSAGATAILKTPESVIISEETSESLQVKIQRRAYELWLDHGQNPGTEVDDWLQAEAEILNTTESTAE